MVYDDFLTFMQAEVLPRHAANPDHIRLDGEITGGNRYVIGQFRHNGLQWKVHADTHYEPLVIAYTGAEAGEDPFEEEDTPRSRCLSLKPGLRAQYPSPHKHLYIYLSSGVAR